MAWTHLNSNWDQTIATAQRLFPGVSVSDLMSLDDDSEAFVAHIADTHELTRAEAREVVACRLAIAVQDNQQIAAQ